MPSKRASKTQSTEKRKDSGELTQLLKDVSKVHGDNVIARGRNTMMSWRYLPTGITVLDLAMLGGIPENVITCLYGWESSGKTTLAMRTVASAQKKYPDKCVAYVDIEGTYDRTWAELNGVDHSEDKFLYILPDTGEQGVDIINALLATLDVSLVVCDSIAAMMPSKMEEASAEDNLMALQARMINRFVAKASLTLTKERKRGHTVSLICINQFRRTMVMMGDNRTICGGVGQNFFYTTMIEVKNKKEIIAKDSRGIDCIQFSDHAFLIKKAKTGKVFNSGEFSLVSSHGHRLPKGSIDDLAVVTSFAKKAGIISGEGGSKKTIVGIDKEFAKFSDIEDWMIEDRANYLLMRRLLIMAERETQQLAADSRDDYLC